MVKACCVKNCESNSRNASGRVSLHLFPSTNAELMSQWIDFLGYGKDWKPPKYAAICSYHFDYSDFSLNTNIRRLLPNAVPSVKAEYIAEKPKKGVKLKKHLKAANLEKDETNLTLDIKRTCRLCGNEYKNVLKDIFENDSFIERINKYLYLSIVSDDRMPTSLCKLCEKKIDEFEQFALKVNEAQAVLAKRFNAEPDQTCSDNAKSNPTYSDHSSYSIMKDHQIITQPIVQEVNTIVTEQIPTNPIHSNLTYYYEDNTIGDNNNDNTSYDLIDVKSVNNPVNPPFDYNSNAYIPIYDEAPLVPIKMEIVKLTSEHVELPNPIKPVNVNSKKKIEILQDIQLEPNSISLKSLKPTIPDCKNKPILLNRSKKVPVVEKKISKHKTDSLTSIFSKSDLICPNCGTKFISKCALNNHVKYICVNSAEIKIGAKCANCRKNSSGKLKSTCKCRQNKAFTHKRKSYKPMKVQQ